MKTKESKKEKRISLVRYSLYSIGLSALILLGQFYMMIKNILPSAPIFIGPIYLPLFISIILLLLLIVAGRIMLKQYQKREATDELADLNKYKAGYITMFINVFLIAIIILLVKEYHFVFNVDKVGNALSALVIGFSITNLIYNIVFIVLEKVK